MISLVILLAQGVDAGTWKVLVTNFGVPGAFLFVAVVSLTRGWVISKREADDLRKRCADDGAEWLSRYNEMKKEKDYWRDLALRATTTAEKATNTASKLVGGQ